MFHRINGQMEPRLATHATPTPVETSTPPNICLGGRLRLIPTKYMLQLYHYITKAAYRPLILLSVAEGPVHLPLRIPLGDILALVI